MMKNISACIAVLFSLVLLAGCGSGPQRAEIGSPAPDFIVTDLSGKDWTLAQLKGKVVFLHFWATWCPSCRDELPSIQRLHASLPTEQVVVLSVLSNDDPNLAKAMASQLGLAFPVSVDPNSKAAQAYGLTGVPETYIIDQQGILRERKIGAVHWDSPEPRQMLAQYFSR